MNIYQGNYLTIEYQSENDLFIQNWSKSPLTLNEFKNEMLEYEGKYKKYKPSFTLWNQENFKLNLDTETYNWIEEKINIPCHKHGNKKAAFIVGKDVLSHIDVMDSFKEINSIINVKHFADKEDAIKWLNSYELNLTNNKKIDVLFDGIDKNGDAIIKIISPSVNISETLQTIKNLIESNNFKNSKLYLYNTLTNREKQVLSNLADGLSIKEVSIKLSISYSTTQTHWKKLKKKLSLNSLKETLLFR